MSLHYLQAKCVRESGKITVSWGRDKGGKRLVCFWGQRMSFSLRILLTLLVVKLTGPLMCLAVLGLRDQLYRV